MLVDDEAHARRNHHPSTIEITTTPGGDFLRTVGRQHLGKWTMTNLCYKARPYPALNVVLLASLNHFKSQTDIRHGRLMLSGLQNAFSGSLPHPDLAFTEQK